MLTLSEVTYRVGGRTGRRLLDQANAQIFEGAKVGLVGRNGAGKSTRGQILRRRIWAATGASIERVSDSYIFIHDHIVFRKGFDDLLCAFSDIEATIVPS